MINMLQCTAEHDLKNIELWFDIMEVPETINNLKEYLELAKSDFSDRKVRIIQVMES